MNSITIVAAYWNQPAIIAEWWEVLRSYDADMVPHIRLMMCDDHSEIHPLVIPQDIREKFRAKHFRLSTPGTWREMACRNICMKHAEGWVFMTDPDFIFCNQEMRKVLEMALKRGVHYHFNSRHHIDKTFKPLFKPQNMGLIHRDDFWIGGGYDEDFAGNYGFSDTLMWRNLLQCCGQKQVLLDKIFMDHYPKGKAQSNFGDKIIADACAPAKVKDTAKNRIVMSRKMALLQRNKYQVYKDGLQPFRFPWVEVA